MKKLFVTFGDGSYNFKQAVKRIVSQAEASNYFDKCVGLNCAEFEELSPTFKEAQKNLAQIAKSPYFFRAGKTYLIHEALQGVFGDYDVIVYADPGCEIISNRTSLNNLDKMIEKAVFHHGFAEQLDAPEWKYSKKYFLDSVNATNEEKLTGQIQATFSIFHNCPESREFSQEWVRWTESKLNYWQDPINEIQEEGFIAHRNDQSLFSILWKRSNFSVGPVSRNFRKYFDFFQSASIPIHTLRNRSGKSVIPRIYNLDLTGKVGSILDLMILSARK